MSLNEKSTPANPDGKQLAGISEMTLGLSGEVQIDHRRYINPQRLARMLSVSVRTLGRWQAVRIGPPQIKVGKLRLYDLAKLPEWLSGRETAPVRIRSHSGRAAQ
ncbi:MAG TPA: hypothetical protein VLX09_25365 [Stellaceae bacterium]|nr:hypothetical protein [Stellaceae bacterium]